MPEPYVAQASEQQQLEWLNGANLAVLLDTETTGGQLMMGRFTHKQGDATPYHLHHNEDEMFLLLSGTAKVWCDDIEHDLGEGGVVFLPRGIPHAYRITSESADLLMITTPPGLEAMFRGIGRDKSTPRPDGFEIKPNPELVARFGNEIVGPPR